MPQRPRPPRALPRVPRHATLRRGSYREYCALLDLYAPSNECWMWNRNTPSPAPINCRAAPLARQRGAPQAPALRSGQRREPQGRTPS